MMVVSVVACSHNVYGMEAACALQRADVASVSRSKPGKPCRTTTDGHVGHTFGKGEVESSILSRSTIRKPLQTLDSVQADNAVQKSIPDRFGSHLGSHAGNGLAEKASAEERFAAPLFGLRGFGLLPLAGGKVRDDRTEIRRRGRCLLRRDEIAERLSGVAI